MKQMKKHEPKFKVGDKVKNIWINKVYTVASVKDGGYMLDDRYLPFDDEMCWVLADKPEKPESRPEPTRKFNIGDIVQRKDGCCFQYRITGYDGDDYVAVDTFKLERGLKSPFDITKIGRNDDDWELVEKAELNVQPFVPKFKVGDIIVCKDDGLIYGIRYVITEIKQDRYVAIPHNYEIQPKEDKVIPFDDENKWCYPLEATELENKVLKPKFKVGDRVKRKVVDPHNPTTKFVFTVIEIEDDIYHKYCLDHDDHESWIPISAQDELELVNEREHKFILGDIVVRVKHGVYGERYFIQRIDDDCYIAYPYGVGGDLSDKEQKIWYNEEDEWELFSNAVKMSIKPEQPLFETCFDLTATPNVNEIWKNTLTNLINDITKRNTASFFYMIDETLRYMDCDAFVDDARVGMRQFVDELKKRLTV